MNGKLNIGDLSRFAKDMGIVDESVKKAATIRSFANTGGAGMRNKLTVALSVAGSHGDSTPLELGSDIMNELTQEEFNMLLHLFAESQQRIVNRMINHVDELYGVRVEV